MRLVQSHETMEIFNSLTKTPQTKILQQGERRGTRATGPEN